MKKKFTIPFGVLVIGLLMILGFRDGCKKKDLAPAALDMTRRALDLKHPLAEDEIIFTSEAPEAVIWFDAAEGQMKFKGDADVAFKEFFKGFKLSVDQYIKENTKTKIVEKIVEKEVVRYHELDTRPYEIIPNTKERKIINLEPGEKFKFIFHNAGE